MTAAYYDAHNHLHDDWLAPYRVDVLRELAAGGVAGCIVNGTSESDWSQVAELAKQNPLVRPSFGLHPWDVGNRSPAWRERLVAELDANPRAMIGEIGLDRWMLDQARPDDPRLAGLRRAPMEEQVEAFRWQFMLAVERRLVASVHCLNAFGHLIETLRSLLQKPHAFLLHAYSGPAGLVPSFVKLGAYFSFNGAFLDPRKQKQRDMYATIPADRLLVETDAPAMLLPSGRREFTLPNTSDNQAVNHPANVVAAYRGLAEIRGVPLERLTSDVAQNFDRLFGA